jgi:hypothetical protein
MKVSFEYDQDPRYGWAFIDLGDSSEGLIIIRTDEGSKGFMYTDGEMKPTCICSAWSRNECACGGWEDAYT